MSYYQRNKRQAQLTSKTKVLLKYYNEMTESDLKNWEDVPEKQMKLILELGFDAIAKVYARRLLDDGKGVAEVAIKTGLSIRKVQGLG